MLMKELKNECDTNLFDYINYFDELENTDYYYNEFIIKYGNKHLIQAVEDLYKVEGLGSIGAIFTLKSTDWKINVNTFDKIQQLTLNDKKIITTTENTETLEKKGVNTENKNSVDNIIPYDIETETETNSNTNSTTLNNNENLTNNKNGKKETIYIGYDKDRLNYLETFKNSPSYRDLIYSDIVNMICLQIY